MFTKLFFLYLTTIFMVVSAGYCPEGWNKFGRSCYYFSDTVNTWYKDVDDCNEKGGHLLRVESQQESDYITLRMKGRQFDDFVFIDGTDELREGRWIWFSTQKTLGFTNWLRLKPSRRDDENCLAICPSAQEYKWSDVPCESKYRYICEKEMLDESQGNSGCLTVQTMLKLFRHNNEDSGGYNSRHITEMAKRVSTLEWKIDHLIRYGNISNPPTKFMQRLRHLEGTYYLFWQSLMALNQSVARLESKMESSLQKSLNSLSRRLTFTNNRVRTLENNWRNMTIAQRRMEMDQNDMENWFKRLNWSMMQNALDHCNFSQSINDLYTQVEYSKDNYLLKKSTRPPTYPPTTPTAVDGSWGSWNPWSTCIVSCGGSTQRRSRQCDNPAPQYGGASCSGSGSDSRSCNTNPCPIDGNWETWITWSTCTVSCGGSTQKRTRQCNNPSPKYGGANCTGSGSDSRSCNTNPCPIDGNWGSWTAWSACAVSCGGSKQTKSRQCDSPVPQNGGANCNGSGSGSQPCNTKPCPIDGNWGTWTAWSACAVSCGGSKQTKSRQCDSPVPQNGGANCTGSGSDSQPCNTKPCPIDGNWGSWTAWSTCTVSCGGSTHTKSRQCDSPVPQNGGANCTGSGSDSQPCNTDPCPIDGQWTKWGSWGTCTAWCDGGDQTRSRSCTNPRPQIGGANCSGDGTDSQPCNTRECIESIQKDFLITTGCSDARTKLHLTAWDEGEVKICQGPTCRNLTLKKGENAFQLTPLVPVPSRLTISDERTVTISSNVNVSVLVQEHMNRLSAMHTFLALPLEMLSSKYVIATYRPYRFSHLYCYVQVAALQDGTQTNFTLKMRNGPKNDFAYNNKDYNNGDMLQVGLNTRQTFKVAGRTDFTGTYVQSSKPVAVFSGCCGAEVRTFKTDDDIDFMVQMIPPTKCLRNKFIIPPFITRLGFIVRVVAAERNTTIVLNETSYDLPSIGSFFEYDANTSIPMTVSSNKQVLTVLYAKTGFGKDKLTTLEGGGGNMIIVPALSQYISTYSFVVPKAEKFSNSVNDSYVTVISPQSTTPSLEIDGSPLQTKAANTVNETRTVTFESVTYDIISFQLDPGLYNISSSATESFGLIFYGFKYGNGWGNPVYLNC